MFGAVCRWWCHDGWVRLAGWNWIPGGYELRWERAAAPWWLRAWFVTPFIDRFAYPVMIRRGYAWLVPDPGQPRHPVPAGWSVREAEPATVHYRSATWHARRLRWSLSLPVVVTLPGGHRFERYAYLFWRVRLALWAVLAAPGGILLGRAGAVVGLCLAGVVEILFSYRPPGGARATPRPHPGGSAGVREPRRPPPPITPARTAAELPKLKDR